jgi:hypothetical protein
MRSPTSIVSGYLRLLQQDSDGLSAQEIGELASLEGTVLVPSSTAVQVFDLCGDALKSLSAEAENGTTPVFRCHEPAYNFPTSAAGRPTLVRQPSKQYSK